MDLSDVEVRVLGCLIEKERTVPDAYPLTLNALRLACNQTSGRNPIVAFDDRAVDAALLSLKSQGLVRFVHPAHGSRTTRYRHVADERWRMGPAELAALSALVLRGPQTGAEVRARTERQHDFADLAAVEAVLDQLSARTPEPFVTRLGRGSGRAAGPSDPRWAHLLAGAPSDDDPGPDLARYSAKGAASGVTSRVVALEAEVASLGQRLAALERELGFTE